MSLQQQLQQAFFEQQISGHSIFIKLNDGEFVAKSYSIENNNEQNFYEWIQQIDGYQEFFSQYNGVVILEKSQQLSNQQTINSQQQWLNSLISKRYNPNNTKYLLLENLTQNSQNLRILDLKLGYTVHKESHVQRYENSTSSKIGLRICGMKIQENNELVIFKDKHWGRTISVEELVESLKTFFNLKNRNSKLSFKLEILKEAIDKIESLKQFITNHCKQVISWQGTSLLLIYRDDNDFKIKLIDFSNTKVDPESTEINAEIIKALNSLQDIIKQI
ncbi:unnamed protein product (macronuclear) [Paramecium tetraurelia]|uniref:Kinase n=1 Tax=Paramecium tetraurelia TaxID=5888 RepID=A0DZR9_PARTE|nr:uncharacterized protein GSPATT00021704001 [Paramecium tetraurelia]CAK88536.1 unnamed protein product [Paramecium tetraurelia]|eukprot:XP_001455933.1 hypothetical protein (macronuclear) [Paramecium tetraurelia strain d4-2]